MRVALSYGQFYVLLWCLYMNYASRYALTSIDDIKKVVHGVIGGLEKKIELTDERRYDVALVINELLVNSFEHANPTKNAPVIFKASMTNGCLNMCVIDQGEGFSYDRLHEGHTCDESALMRERGRGLMLVRALCQEICYNGTGNCVEVKIGL